MSTPTAIRPIHRAPSPWTRRLQVLVAVCSAVFLVGTTLHNFAVVDVELIETMMREAGGEDPAGAAPGFTTGFRIVGCLYLLGNAMGLLALRFRPAWLYWVVLVVNATQGLGYLMIPSQMWTAAADRYGVLGTLPSAITDGGAGLLALVLIIALVAYRRPWALRSVPGRATGDDARR